MLISLILTGSWDQDTTCSTVRIQGLENVNSKDEFVYAALVYSTRMEGRLPKPVKKGRFRTYTRVHIPDLFSPRCLLPLEKMRREEDRQPWVN